jgi:hypothetical protein
LFELGQALFQFDGFAFLQRLLTELSLDFLFSPCYPVTQIFFIFIR